MAGRPVAPAPGDGEEVLAGDQIFAANCATCHTLAAARSAGTVGPNLDDVQPSVDQVVQIVTNGRGGMPSFEGRLSEEQIQNVAQYVSENAGQ